MSRSGYLPKSSFNKGIAVCWRLRNFLFIDSKYSVCYHQQGEQVQLYSLPCDTHFQLHHAWSEGIQEGEGLQCVTRVESGTTFRRYSGSTPMQLYHSTRHSIHFLAPEVLLFFFLQGIISNNDRSHCKPTSGTVGSRSFWLLPHWVFNEQIKRLDLNNGCSKHLCISSPHPNIHLHVLILNATWRSLPGSWVLEPC